MAEGKKDFFCLEVLLFTPLYVPPEVSVNSLWWEWVGFQRMEAVLLQIQFWWSPRSVF